MIFVIFWEKEKKLKKLDKVIGKFRKLSRMGTSNSKSSKRPTKSQKQDLIGNSKWLGSKITIFHHKLNYYYYLRFSMKKLICIFHQKLLYNPHIPNIDALNSDTHTLFLSILILNSQCVGVAIEGMDIWYVGLIAYGERRWVHKLWLYQNGMFSIREIGKNRKKNLIFGKKQQELSDILIVTACSDT